MGDKAAGVSDDMINMLAGQQMVSVEAPGATNSGAQGVGCRCRAVLCPRDLHAADVASLFIDSDSVITFQPCCAGDITFHSILSLSRLCLRLCSPHTLTSPPHPLCPSLLQVEPIALLANSPASGFVGVYMYCDDQATLKHLPHNMRATQIAAEAGQALQVTNWGW